MTLRAGLLVYSGLSMAALAGAPADSPGQELRSLAPDRSCDCSVILRRVATLGPQVDSTALSRRSDLARDSRGFYFIAPLHQEGRVAVLNSAGAFIGSAGRYGHGPGELSRIRDIKAAPGDSLLVLDYERLTLFSPSRGYVRDKRLPDGLQAYRMAVLPDGKVLLNNHMPKRRSFTLLDANFNELRTFGRSIADKQFPDVEAMLFLMAPLDSGRFATVQANYRYLIQVWDTGGRLRRQFQRDPDWFTRSTFEERLALTPRSPPAIRVIGAHADMTKLQLWIVALVPDRNWRAVAPTVDPGRRESAGWLGLPPSDYPRAYDTIIEVLDLESGDVLFTQRFDTYLTGFTEEGLLYGLRYANGVLVFDVWQPKIVDAR